MKIIALATLFLLVASAGADTNTLGLPSTFCSSLFSQSSANPMSLTYAGTYASVLGVSLLVVLVVLTVLGVVYAFGMAFKVESLKAFTRSEFLESFFNILLIVVISSGIALSGAAISFISNLGLAGIQSLSSQAGSAAISPAQVVQVSDTQSVYTAICNNYVTNGINTWMHDITYTGLVSIVLNSVMNFKLALTPLGEGVTFSPMAGAYPVYYFINMQIELFVAMIGIMLMVTFLLYIVYSIFPVFLYVGILLRSFPWTRAAGGTFIALFIAFYIIFPAVLFPFSLYMQNLYTALNLSPSSYTAFSVGGLLEVLPFLSTFTSGSPMLNEMSGFAQTAGLVGLQLMGVLIGFVVSLDLVEAIAKLLGAPSMHTRSLLGKIL